MIPLAADPGREAVAALFLSSQQIEQRRAGAWRLQPEMPPPRLAQHAASAGAQDQAFLDQVWLDDVLERVARLGQRGGQGFHPDRTAGVVTG